MKTTKIQDLELLEQMMRNFYDEMDMDGYGIDKIGDVPYHFVIEDIGSCGWDYVHGAKRFIEYFFDICDDKSHYTYSIGVRAKFVEGKKSIQLYRDPQNPTTVVVDTLDITFIVTSR